MKNLTDFITKLEKAGELVRTKQPISTYLELTEIQSRLLAKAGPALLCENVIHKDGTPSKYPVLINLFGAKSRFYLGLGKTAEEIKELGELLAFLRQPKPPKNLKDAFSYLPLLKQVMTMAPNVVKKASSQAIVYSGNEVNLDDLPIQECWPNEPAP